MGGGMSLEGIDKARRGKKRSVSSAESVGMETEGEATEKRRLILKDVGDYTTAVKTTTFSDKKELVLIRAAIERVHDRLTPYLKFASLVAEFSGRRRRTGEVNIHRFAYIDVGKLSDIEKMMTSPESLLGYYLARFVDVPKDVLESITEKISEQLQKVEQRTTAATPTPSMVTIPTVPPVKRFRLSLPALTTREPPPIPTAIPTTTASTTPPPGSRSDPSSRTTTPTKTELVQDQPIVMTAPAALGKTTSTLLVPPSTPATPTQTVMQPTQVQEPASMIEQLQQQPPPTRSIPGMKEDIDFVMLPAMALRPEFYEIVKLQLDEMNMTIGRVTDATKFTFEQILRDEEGMRRFARRVSATIRNNDNTRPTHYTLQQYNAVIVDVDTWFSDVFSKRVYRFLPPSIASISKSEIAQGGQLPSQYGGKPLPMQQISAALTEQINTLNSTAMLRFKNIMNDLYKEHGSRANIFAPYIFELVRR